MYRTSYAEVLADSAADARAVERSALDRAISLLERADGAAPHGPEQTKAIEFTTQLWGLFINDLAREDNDLPGKLRAQLMSIGLGVIGEAQRIAQGLSRDFRSLAEICTIVRDALA
jgi:flagellar biosynthesis activator protein FlaF